MAVPLVLLVCGTTFAQTIYVTPKNGVPSAWELVAVEPDRIVVRKGGARFEFSKEQIDKITNPEATQLVEAAQTLLTEVAKHDPKTFPDLEPRLARILPNLETSARKFSWILPELTEARDRVAEAKEGIEKTLDITGAFDADLKAIELMALGRAPVATNWEEVVDNTLARAREIPFEEVSQQVIAEIDKFRRTIRLTLVRRTEETNTRVRTRGESLLAELGRGEIDHNQWSLVLRDLRRQVAEQVPDPDLRLELEAFLDGVEADSQDKLESAQWAVAQREIRQGLSAIEGLTLDTTRTEEFKSQSAALAIRIGELPESATRESFLSILTGHRADHDVALAQLERALQPPGETAAGTPKGISRRAAGWEKYFADWRVLAGGTVAILLVLGILQLLLSKRGRKKAAAEIEDLKEVPLEAAAVGWAGGQDDLLSMLGGKKESSQPTEAVYRPEPKLEIATEDDPFGLAISPPSEAPPDDLWTTESEEQEIDKVDLFGLTEEETPAEEPSKGPRDSRQEDPLSFSTDFAKKETEEAPPSPSSDASDPLSGGDDSEVWDDPLGLAKPTPDPDVESPPAPAPEQAPPPAKEEDPFDLFAEPPTPPVSPAREEERVDDLFGSPEPRPPKKKEGEGEEDIFGFGDYFESPEGGPDKDR